MKKNIEIPEFVMDELNKERNALITFENLSISCKNEYLKWILDAKKTETQKRRISKMILELLNKNK